MEFDDLSEEEWKLLKWKTFHSYQKEFAPKKNFYKNTGKDSLRLAAVSTISIVSIVPKFQIMFLFLICVLF
jgi:hypothetical protein